MHRQEAGLAAVERQLREVAAVGLGEVAHVGLLGSYAAALQDLHVLEVTLGTDAVAYGVELLVLARQSCCLLCGSCVEAIDVAHALREHGVQQTDGEVLTLQLLGEGLHALLLHLELLAERRDGGLQATVLSAALLELLGQGIDSVVAGAELVVDQEHIVLDAIALRAADVALHGVDVDHPLDRGDLLEVGQDACHEGVGLVEFGLVVLVDDGERVVLSLQCLILTRVRRAGC